MYKMLENNLIQVTDNISCDAIENICSIPETPTQNVVPTNVSESAFDDQYLIPAEIGAETSVHNVNNMSSEKANECGVQRLFETICRCCLDQPEELKPIFDPSQCIPDMIYLFTSVKISNTDSLPANMCLNCLEGLTNCISFKQHVEAADKCLKEYISNGFQQRSISLDKDVGSQEKSASTEDLQCILEDSEILCSQSYCNEEIQIYLMDDETDQVDNEEEQNEQDPNTEIEVIDMKPFAESRPANAKELPETDICEKQLEKEGTNDLIIVHTEDSESQSRLEVDDTYDENIQLAQLNKERGNGTKSSCSSKAPTLTKKKRTKTESEGLYCDICFRSFQSHQRQVYERHLKCHSIQNESYRQIADFKTFICENCEEKFASENDLNLHKTIHSQNDGPYICRNCEKEFSNLFKLKRHLPIHFEIKPFYCDVCNTGFPEMASLTRHYRRHTGEKKERKFVCKICDKKYFDAYSLKIHARSHTGEKPWSCKECDKAFADCRLLNSHLRTHQNEKTFTCKQCGKKFTHSSTLVAHLRLHTGERPFACVICLKTFTQVSNLNVHMKVHSDEKSYECDICSKSFKTSSRLFSHRETHTTEKLGECPDCGKRFSRSHISTHLRIHKGIMPFKCNKCSQSFVSKSNLRTHERSHISQKAFTCDLCDKGWSCALYLRMHMTKYHPKRQPKDQSLVITQGDPTVFQHQDSDAELNESEALVNDLLASVVEERTSITCEDREQ